MPPPAKLRSTGLKAEFAVPDAADGVQGGKIGPTRATVLLTDECGKKSIRVNVVERNARPRVNNLPHTVTGKISTPTTTG